MPRKKVQGLGRIVPLVSLLLLMVAVFGCSRTPEAKQAKFLESGKKYLEAKDYARAILQFKNAARFKPADPEPYYQLGLAYLATGDLNSGAANLQKASELDPKHVGAQLKIAELMAVNRSVEVVREAEKRAQAVLEVSPENPDALATLAVTELRLGKPEDAENHLLQALEKFPQHLKSSTTLATVKLSRKDLKGAEEVLQEAVKQASKSPQPPLALGRFYLMIGKSAEAEAQLRRALEMDPKNAFALLDLGAIQARAGQREQADQTYKRLSQLPDKQYKPFHAMFLFQDGQRDAAIAEFEKLAKEGPNDRAARTRLVAAYVAVNRMQDAEKVLTAALEQNSKDVEALLQRSEVYVRAGKHTSAQRDLTQVLRFRPESGEAHYILAKLYQARGSALQQRQELTEAVRLKPDFLAARIDLAQVLIEAKSPQAAVDLMNQTPEAQSQMLGVIVQRNWALLLLGDKKELRKWIDQALPKARMPDLLLQDGLLKLQEKDYSGARASLEEALLQSPEDTRALDALAKGYVAQNQPNNALEAVRRYASQRPKSAPLQFFLGDWLAKSGYATEARAAFKASKAADPNYKVADLFLAQLDISDGKLDAARQALGGILAADRRNTTARLMLAVMEDQARNYRVAEEHYRKVIEADPANIVALNNLAYRLANDLNQPDEALRFAQRVKEVAPDHPSVEDTIGWAFYRKGIYRTAVVHLENAASKATHNMTIKYHLGMAYLKAGDRTRGQQTLQAALKVSPNLPEAKLALEVLHETVEQ